MQKKLKFLLGFLAVLSVMLWQGDNAWAQTQNDLKIEKVEISPRSGPWNGPTASPAPREFGPKNLDGLLAELLGFNPELKATIEKIQALENRIDPAGALDDPRLAFEGSNITINPPALNRTPMTGLQLYYRQKVPWPGKLKLKKKIAASQAEQEKEAYYERLNQLVAKFKQTYYDYRLTSELLAIYQSTTARLSGLGKILEARYSAGDTPMQDVLKNKVETSTLRETIVALKEKQKILKARMNTWLNRPAGLELKIMPEGNSPSNLSASLFKLLEISKRNRPWLKKSDLEIQEADLQHRLAKKGLLPDFDFGAGWRFRQASPGDPVTGEDFFSAGFSLNLPIFAGKKQKKEIAAAVHEKRMQEYLKEATTQEVLYQVEQTFHQLNQLRSQYEISRSRSVPQARAAVTSSRLNYEAEEIDFLNVLTNEIALLNQRLNEVRYRYEYEKKIAELEVATGLPLHLLNTLTQTDEAPHEDL